MTRIDRALAKNPFSVDPTQCYLVGSRLRGFRVFIDSTPWGSASRESQFVFKLFFVAICHQINWDFLQTRMFDHFFSSNAEEMHVRASAATPSFITNMLRGYHRPERLRAAERARFLREVADALSALLPSRKYLQLAEGGQIFGSGGLMERLRQLPAFREDPLAKKANAFVQELAREGIVKFSDAALIPPAIDYHLIRLYLRTGRVVPNPAVYRVLTAGSTHRPRLLRLLRETVSSALVETARFSGLQVHEVNYIEWQLGRNRCEKDSVNCEGDWPKELADPSIRALNPACPNREVCLAYSMPQWKQMIEPEMKKAFY